MIASSAELLSALVGALDKEHCNGLPIPRSFSVQILMERARRQLALPPLDTIDDSIRRLVEAEEARGG